MSEENVRVVQAGIAAYNRGDWTAVLSFMTPDVEVDFSRAEGPLHGVFRRDELRGMLDELADVWEWIRLEADEIIEVGESVIVPVTMHVRGRHGIEVTSRPTHVYTIRGGAISRLTMYQEREDALEALKIRE